MTLNSYINSFSSPKKLIPTSFHASSFKPHRIHGWHISLYNIYIYHKNQPNVGNYTIHGSYENMILDNIFQQLHVVVSSFQLLTCFMYQPRGMVSFLQKVQIKILLQSCDKTDIPTRDIWEQHASSTKNTNIKHNRDEFYHGGPQKTIPARMALVSFDLKINIM